MCPPVDSLSDCVFGPVGTAVHRNAFLIVFQCRPKWVPLCYPSRWSHQASVCGSLPCLSLASVPVITLPLRWSFLILHADWLLTLAFCPGRILRYVSQVRMLPCAGAIAVSGWGRGAGGAVITPCGGVVTKRGWCCLGERPGCGSGWHGLQVGALWVRFLMCSWFKYVLHSRFRIYFSC